MAFHTINGRSVAYRLLGAQVNPLVVLAHPLGMSQAVWDDVIPALLSRYRVLTWDLPGHGASQAVSGEQITPADLAAEALALVELAGAQRFHFAGTSIGGVVGQQLIIPNLCTSTPPPQPPPSSNVAATRSFAPGQCLLVPGNGAAGYAYPYGPQTTTFGTGGSYYAIQGVRYTSGQTWYSLETDPGSGNPVVWVKDVDTAKSGDCGV